MTALNKFSDQAPAVSLTDCKVGRLLLPITPAYRREGPSKQFPVTCGYRKYKTRLVQRKLHVFYPVIYNFVFFFSFSMRSNESLWY
jgi:hypothetical protein